LHGFFGFGGELGPLDIVGDLLGPTGSGLLEVGGCTACGDIDCGTTGVDGYGGLGTGRDGAAEGM
jgi:hypothetical protein